MNGILAAFFKLIFVIIFMAIGALGFLIYQQYQGAKQPVIDQQTTQLNQNDQQDLYKLGLLKSSVVASITLFGEVKSISGNTITLSSGQANLPLIVGAQAKIYSTTTSSGKLTAAHLSDIKTGKNLQVEAQLSQDSQLVGYSVIIID